MKKALAALLALILLVALIPNVATAEEGTYAYELVIRGGSIPGNTVTVDGQDCLKVDVWINGIDDDHLLASTSFSIGYNTDQLTYVSAEQGSLYAVDKDGKNQGTQSLIINNKDGELRFALASSYGCRIQSNKPLVTLYFTVSDSLTSADTIAFELGDKVTAESVVMTQQIEGQTKTTKCNLTADFRLYRMVAPIFKSHTLEMEGLIGVHFYMSLPEISGVDYTESYMTFDISGRGTITERDNYDARDKSGNPPLYRFSCYISSIQMADVITATFHYGTDLTVEETYSVKTYLEAFDKAIENNPNLVKPKMKAAVEALADFGHYAQAFLAKYTNSWTLGKDYAEMDHYYKKSYDLNTIKTALSDYEIVRTNNSGGDIKGTPSFTLVLDSATAIRVTFEPASGYTGKFTVKLDGKSYTAEKTGGKYVVEISNIPSYELSVTHTIVATTEHGTVTVKVSGLSYAYALMNAYADQTKYKTENYAAAAIYSYSQAAEAFVNKN